MEPDGGADREQHNPPGKTRPANWGIAFDLGIRLGLSVIVGLGGGLLLDNWLHTSPIFTLIGMVLGIGAAMYTIWDVARDTMRS
ncbi:MAG: AtpZ/AtpI family protein [Candidatus Limnocylindria bacterium]